MCVCVWFGGEGYFHTMALLFISHGSMKGIRRLQDDTLTEKKLGKKNPASVIAVPIPLLLINGWDSFNFLL